MYGVPGRIVPSTMPSKVDILTSTHRIYRRAGWDHGHEDDSGLDEWLLQLDGQPVKKSHGFFAGRDRRVPRDS